MADIGSVSEDITIKRIRLKTNEHRLNIQRHELRQLELKQEVERLEIEKEVNAQEIRKLEEELKKYDTKA